MPLDLSTSTKFTTNFDNDTSTTEAVKDLATKSAKLNFLVGYFFFSGFTELCKAKAIGVETPLRILVGMDVDVEVRDIIEKAPIRDDSDKSPNPLKSDIRSRFEKIQIKSFNTEEFDRLEKKEAALFFAEKLKNGTLEVRKTKEPNHAKMYLFAFPSSGTSKPTDDKGRVLIGSSNLSYQGFVGRNEINVLLKDNHDFDDASKIFEHLWKDAVTIADKDTNIDELLEQTWVKADFAPYLMYIRTLHEYFSVNTGEFKTPRECVSEDDNEVIDISYQTDAVQEGIYKIRKHSGCIIADVVGLGKTIVAATIAKNLNLKTVIICPPHLIEQWKYEKNRFLINADIFSSGLIEEAAKNFAGKRNLLVIVDEAHRFRNERTATYAALHKLCSGKKVILLSATPFNNRPEDIFSMVKLFQIPSHATIQTVNNLGDKMAELTERYKKLKKKDRQNIASQKKDLASEIKDILDPVMIRRTRTDLKKVKKYDDDLKAQHIEFSKLEDPIPLNYDLGELSDLYISTLDRIKPTNGMFEQGTFKATRYHPLTYLKDDPKIIEKYRELFSIDNFQPGQKNMATFMQRLLVRRFESCSTSFKKSLENLIKSCKTIKDWLEQKGEIPLCKRGRIPEISDFEETDDPNEDVTISPLDDLDKDIQDLKSRKGVLFVNANELKPSFKVDLEDDINVLSELLAEWERETENFKIDPKLDVIVDELKKRLKKESKRKLIIFTEFKDTADYLASKFEERGLKRTFKYTGDTATKGNRETVRKNFDASLPEKDRNNDFDVLVATDSISEGYSLHRAGAIYNYDIPYNPTRVIQRMGRIDRMNKKMFPELFIYNFFPTAIGERITRTTRIAKFKIDIFNALLGSDAKLLSRDENLEGYLRDKILEKYNEGTGEDSWKSEFLNDLHRVENEEEDLLRQAKKIPPRTRISRPDAPSETPQGVYVFAKKGDDCRFAFAPSDGSEPEVLSPEEALKIFRARKDEKHYDVSGEFYTFYKKACESTGKTKQSTKISKQEQEADRKLKYVLGVFEKQNEKETGEFKYLEKLSKVIKNKGLTSYHIRFIKTEKLDKLEDVASFRENIPEGYLDGILEKISAIDSAPESVVLSEEFQNSLLI